MINSFEFIELLEYMKFSFFLKFFIFFQKICETSGQSKLFLKSIENLQIFSEDRGDPAISGNGFKSKIERIENSQKSKINN